MKIISKFLISSAIALGLLVAPIALAHVVVRPSSVGIGARQVFMISVPSEKDIPTVGLRLLVPEGIKSVTPNVKPGWKIEVKKKPTGKKTTDEDGEEVDELLPAEINWTGGSIPGEQRDEFLFATQAPVSPTTLIWKAYQTYADGSVVAWDETPGNNSKNPYSITEVIDDLTNKDQSWWVSNRINITLGISLLALIMSLAIFLRKDNEK